MAQNNNYYKDKNNGNVLVFGNEINLEVNPHLEIITKAQYNAAVEIKSLKQQLAKTDYQAIKYAEGWISEQDYAPIKAQRQSLRDQINELEQQLN